MKRRRSVPGRRWIFLALSLLWMLVIFTFSAQDGEASGTISITVSSALHLPEWLIRKGAHMAEYVVLAVLLSGFFSTFPSLGRKRQGAAAWLFSVLYAATDEFHQIFSGGRTPAVRDVLIDGSGAALGAALFFLAVWMKEKRQRKIQEQIDWKDLTKEGRG
ncbi:VanZ family protein [Lacrimispora sp. NSJ-141]|uniref:VanZ family protein n=1 Tax=Lientehia hominis TaxID=2897778 RepID=A0AAP2W9N2_9FIRM|nr:VanZ family protein [Lientehia hominis]MCD2492117.1 VanZ family protein [Lientehia hominis]